MHEVLCYFVDGGVFDEPLAEIDGCVDYTRLVDQHVHSQLLGCLDDFVLDNSVLDQVFAVDDGLVDEPLVLDPVEKEVE